jgi:hypothetical protein
LSPASSVQLSSILAAVALAELGWPLVGLHFERGALSAMVVGTGRSRALPRVVVAGERDAAAGRAVLRGLGFAGLLAGCHLTGRSGRGIVPTSGSGNVYTFARM